jgi:hypothetical protein
MAIYYLDVDDEITSAAARLRDSSDSRIALVLSAGSRVATSRINFRLLAREAKKRNKRLAIVAADPSVQSVARSAELPVYASVGDYERAEAVVAAHGAGGVGDALDELALTVKPGTPGLIGRGGSTRVTTGRQTPGSGPRRTLPKPVAIGVGLALALVLAVAGVVLLPAATVVVTLREEPLAPMALNLTVDPAVKAVNDQTSTVPGVVVSFAVDAAGTFNATGEKSVDTAATGTVTFTSINPADPVTIPSGTVVSTTTGVDFATTSAVTVKQAGLSGLTIIPTKADAPVQAAKKGVAGNVASGAIVNVPSGLAKKLVSVSNKAATAGGTHTVVPEVQQSDVDAAVAGLQQQLQTQFAADVSGPGALNAVQTPPSGQSDAASTAAAPPSGQTIISESGQLGDVTCNPDPASAVGTDNQTFDLACKATGTAMAVNMADVGEIAMKRASAGVQTGYTLVESSVATVVGKAVSHDGTVTLPLTVTAGQDPVVDVADIRAQIRGKSLAEAKALLAKLGQVDVSLWPFWVTDVPGFDFRIDIKIVDVTSTPTGSPRPATRRTGSPTTNASPDAMPSPSDASTPSPEPTDTAAPTDTPAATDTPAVDFPSPTPPSV